MSLFLRGFDNVFFKKNIIIIIIITVFIQFKILSRETSLSTYTQALAHMSGVKNMAGLLFWKKKYLEVRVEVRLELK